MAACKRGAQLVRLHGFDQDGGHRKVCRQICILIACAEDDPDAGLMQLSCKLDSCFSSKIEIEQREIEPPRLRQHEGVRKPAGFSRNRNPERCHLRLQRKRNQRLVFHDQDL